MLKNTKIFLQRIYGSFNFSGVYFNSCLSTFSPPLGEEILTLLSPLFWALKPSAISPGVGIPLQTATPEPYEHQEVNVSGSPLLDGGVGCEETSVSRAEQSGRQRGHTLRPGLAIRRVLSLRYAV